MILAYSVKFERNAPNRGCDIGAVDRFVTDNRPPACFLEHGRKHAVTVKIAEPEND